MQMMGRHRNLNDSRDDDSPADSDGDLSPGGSATDAPLRGCQLQPVQDEVDAQVASEMS